MRRNEIATELTWDLHAFFEDQQAFDDTCEKAKQQLHIVTSYQGHIADTRDRFLQFFKEYEHLLQITENLSVYANMCADVDPEDTLVQENLSKSESIYDTQVSALSFLENELIAKKAIIETYLEDESASDLRFYLSEIFRSIPYRLDDAGEELLAQVYQLARIPEDTFKSFQLRFEPVMMDGKEAFLNGATYSTFLKHKDVKVRKEAFEHYMKEYQAYQNVFMNTLSGHIKGQTLMAKTRHFDHALHASLYEDGVDESLFYKVLDMSNMKYHSYLEEYFLLRKEILQLDTQHVYDIQLSLITSLDIHYTIDECFSIMNQALAPLGEDYVALLHQARQERWIDFMPCAGKRIGAYSWGTYDSRPYVLTNFNGDYDSLSTLAHELGHSMHSYFSWKHHRYLNASYRIFVAEIASTVNELLLNHYLLKHSKDDHEKAYILDNLITQLITTLYRQPMYAQFEVDLYHWIENQEALSSQKITQHYLDLSKAYYGPGVEVDELQRYGCYHIPHFYFNFYVYKYTVGMSIAISFMKRILKGDVEAYRTFLTKGCSESCLDELLHAGVDPREDQVYDDAFTFFKESLDQFKSLSGSI